jgi:hypothetical protein
MQAHEVSTGPETTELDRNSTTSSLVLFCFHNGNLTSSRLLSFDGICVVLLALAR